MFEAEGNRCALGDVADTNPETLAGNTPHSVGFRYIDLSAVEAGFINWGAVAETTFGSAPSRARRIVKTSDILFGTVRPNLKSHGFIGPDQAGLLVASTGFSVVRAREGISHPSYLFHSVMSSLVTAQAVRNAIGSSYPALNDSDVKRFQIFLPSYREQQKIAQVLDILDTAIHEAEAIIAKLKAVKQGFLHDLLTRGIDTKGDLRPSQVDAPHLYKPSPLGWIPKEWGVGYVGTMTDILDSQRVPVNEAERSMRPGDVPYYGANGQQGWIDRPLFDEPLILLAEDGGNFDEFATRPIAYRIDGPAWVNNHAHILKAKACCSQAFIFFALVHRDIRRYISGGTRSKLTAKELKSIELPFPPQAEQAAIAQQLETIEMRLKSELQVGDKLARQKAGLMDDLLTGRVRVTPLLEGATS